MRALLIFVGLAAVVPVCAQTELVLDDFEYPSLDAIQQAWVTAEGGEPAGLFERDGGTALRMNADFTDEQSRRAVYDRDVNLDLSRWGRFTLDIYIDQPGLFGSFTIYFRSGAGWYGAGWYGEPCIARSAASRSRPLSSLAGLSGSRMVETCVPRNRGRRPLARSLPSSTQ